MSSNTTDRLTRVQAYAETLRSIAEVEKAFDVLSRGSTTGFGGLPTVSVRLEKVADYLENGDEQEHRP